jgi:hypothetical protein
MTDDKSETTPDLRREQQRLALGDLLLALESQRASGERSDEQLERVVQLVRSAHNAGLSSDLIATEAEMSINEVLSFLGLSSEEGRPYDWTIFFDA